jgi:hypothetical protein
MLVPGMLVPPPRTSFHTNPPVVSDVPTETTVLAKYPEPVHPKPHYRYTATDALC